MEFGEVAERIAGVPYMSPELGRRVYDHVRTSNVEQALELGTAHGVSAAYIAAALDADGGGHLTTVDHGAASFDPPPEEVLARAGLSDRVTIVRQHSSYNWFLKEQIEQRSDAEGNCAPLYDFAYLDGCKNFSVDGLAVVLIEKLLRPNGWLLMDDLEWTYSLGPWFEPQLDPGGLPRPFGSLSESERTEPHLRAVFELVVKQHPAFTRFIREDEWFGWAQKGQGVRRYELATSRPVGALVAGELRRWRRRRAFGESS
jgi:predicted O-methyltransferase YrrM